MGSFPGPNSGKKLVARTTCLFMLKSLMKKKEFLVLTRQLSPEKAAVLNEEEATVSESLKRQHHRQP